MTADEKALVKRLDEVKAIDNLPREAAALIRRLAAALSDVYSNEYIFVQDHLEASHAEALRNVKEEE